MIQAIETEYKGYRFRSRLEARWAVFFDTLGIQWQYEPQGFEKTTYGFEDDDDDFQTIRYLPDFYLPDTGTWVEVKGVMSESDARKMGQILDWGSPLPWIDDSNYIDGGKNSDKDKFVDSLFPDKGDFVARNKCANRFFPGLVVLGEIPNPHWGHVFHKVIRHAKGLHSSWFEFVPPEYGPLLGIGQEGMEWIHVFADVEFETGWADGTGSGDDDLKKFFAPDHKQFESKRACKAVMEAYKSARQARFEHGESGGFK